MASNTVVCISDFMASLSHHRLEPGYLLLHNASANDTFSFAKFEKYWSEFSLILAIAVILDPRYKLQTVEWGYSKIYGANSSQFEEVKDTLSSLFDIYSVNSLAKKNGDSNSNDVNEPKESLDGICSGIHTNEAWKEFDAFDYEYGLLKSPLHTWLVDKGFLFKMARLYKLTKELFKSSSVLKLYQRTTNVLSIYPTAKFAYFYYFSIIFVYTQTIPGSSSPLCHQV
ncbi:hypothetical protein L2E82_47470 [Cichorium intybus]|uniref:Uncharacterized protein n=1 Tax=Cichorium intybus TaxID=13427 RepID=A0ACB8YVN1_CICIN|nr:hypothetical protein L2E82_47470 [Cichorium intybus]